MSDFNVQAIVDGNPRHFLEGSSDSGLLPDGTTAIVIEDIAHGAPEDVRAWIIANRKSVSSLQVNHNTLAGTWRTVTVELPPQRSEVIWRLARRYDTAIDWAQGRLVGGEEYDTRDDYLRIQFRNLNRDSMETMLRTVQGDTYTNTITLADGAAYTTKNTKDWETLAAFPTWAEDGSGVLDLFMGDPTLQYTGFADFGLPSASDIFYLFNVPKQHVQSTLNGYKVEGNSATTSPGSVPGTMNIVVRTTTNLVVQMVIDPFYPNCTFSRQDFYFWGLTKAVAESTIEAYSSATIGRDVDYNLSFDSTSAKYNVVIHIVTRTSDDVDYVVQESVDADTTYQIRYGITEAALTTLANEYLDGVAGTEKQLRITNRNDDCTFNVVGTQRKTALVDLDFTVQENDDTFVSFQYRYGLTEEEFDAFKVDYAKTSEGVEKQLRVASQNNNSTFDVVGVERKKGWVDDVDFATIMRVISIRVSELTNRVEDHRWGISSIQLVEFMAYYATDSVVTAGEGIAAYPIAMAPPEGFSGRVWSKDLNLSKQGDGSYNVVGILTLDTPTYVEGTIESEVDTDEVAIRFEVDEAGKNAFLANQINSTIGQSGFAGHNDSDEPNVVRGSRSFSVSRNPNGSYTITQRRSRGKKGSESFTWYTGTIKHDVEDYFAHSKKEVALLRSGLREIALGQNNYSVLNLSTSRLSDGTYNVGIRKEEDLGDTFTATVISADNEKDYSLLFGVTKQEVYDLVNGLGEVTDPYERDLSVRRSDRTGQFEVRIITQKMYFDDITAVSSLNAAGDQVVSRWGWSSRRNQIPTMDANSDSVQSFGISKTSSGGYSWRLDSEPVPAEQWSSEFQSVLRVGQSARSSMFRYLRAIPIFDQTRTGAMSVNWDPVTNTYYGVRSYDDLSVNFASEPFLNDVQTTVTVDELFYQTRQGQKYYLVATINYTLLATSDWVKAQDHIDGGQPGSDVSHLSAGRFVAKRVNTAWYTDFGGGSNWHPFGTPA